MKRYLYLIYFFLFFPLFAWAQNTDYQINITSFTEKDGLSNNDVFCINKDARGVLWVGTRYGLNRFDGKGFRSFTAADGLKDNFVNAIFPIGKRYLLLGLGEPNMLNLTLKNYQLIDVFAPQKTIRFDAAFVNTPFSEKQINHIKPLEKGLLFVLKNNKKYFFDKKNKWTKVDFLDPNEMIIAFVPHQYLWVYQYTDKKPVLKKYNLQGKLLFSFVLKTYIFNAVNYLNTDAEGNDYFLHHFEDKEEHTQIIRISHEGKLQVLRTMGRSANADFFLTQWITHNPVTKTYLAINAYRIVSFSKDWKVIWEIPTSAVKLLYQGRQSYFEPSTNWQCSNSGIKRITFKKQKFQTLFKEAEPKSFRQIIRQGDRLLFVSIKGIIEQTKTQTRVLDTTQYLSSVVAGDTVFFSTYKGITQLDKSGKLRTYRSMHYEAWSMWKDADGVLWLGTKGISRFDPQTEQLQPLDYGAEFTALADATVYHFYPLSANRVWLCTTAGLFEFDPKRPKIVAHYHSGGKGKYFLPVNDLRHLYRDPKTGEFWFATGQSGLLRWQPKNGKTKIFRFGNSATNIVHGVYGDEYGFLWLPTDDGIVQFQREDGRFRIYREADGLPTKEFNRISHFRDTDGSFYFGSTNGVVRFFPKDFKNALQQSDKKQLFVIEVQQYEGKSDIGINKTADFLATKRLIVRPSDRFFTMILGIKNENFANDAVYFYKIEGDAVWQTTDKNQLTFWRLPYGKQKILVKARLANGDFSEIFTVKVWVKRPFYLQWWFILCLLFLVALSIFWWFRNLQKRNIELEQEVARRTEQVRQQATELKALDEVKSRFFANVSHELRTPLTLIASPLQRLMNDETNPEKKEFLRFATKNSQRLLRLVNEILDLTKLESAKLNVEPQNVQVVFFGRRILAEFESFAAHKNVALSLETDFSEAVTAFFDIKKVETILYNLISNALKFTPTGGEVVLKIKEKGGNIAFEVTDTGRGIAHEDLPHIFDRFYQSKKQKNAEGGTGIGLAICKEFAILMNGNLTVKSEVGKGSSFEFSLPTTFVFVQNLEVHSEILTENFENNVEENTKQDLERKSTTKTDLPHLLLVEDNEDLQRYISVLLQSNYRLTVANNGKNALDFLNTCVTENRPELILSDIMMPEMDGFQLLQHLKTSPNYRQIPVIMLTARAGTDDRLRALRIGVDDYLTKPFLEEELLARIDNLLQNAAVRQSQSLAAEVAEPTKTTEIIAPEWLENLENLVKSNLNNHEFSVDFITETLQTSRPTLNAYLKKAVGLTAVQYIKEIRLSAARELLENDKSLTIRQIMALVGMNDVKHFRTQYKERFGQLPSERSFG